MAENLDGDVCDSEPIALVSMPVDCIVAILSCAQSTRDLGVASCVSQEFRSTLVERALRKRAQRCSQLVPDTLPSCEISWVQLLCWQERRQLPPPSIAAGALHSAIVTSEGRLLTCGYDIHGRHILGRPPTLEEATTQSQHYLPAPIPPLVILERVVSVATHSMHSLALTADGGVYSFGHGEHGKLGHGDATRDEPVPRRIDGLSGVCIVQVAVGQQHNLLRTSEGAAFSFGSGFSGKLGHGDQSDVHSPRRIEAMADVRVVSVAAGAFHSLVATTDGAFYTFGYGAVGQLGHGVRSDEMKPRRVETLRGERIVAIAGGEHHSLCVDGSGVCYSFGAGEAVYRDGWFGGWLGHGSLDECHKPTIIRGLSGRRVVAVAAGSRHSLVLADGGHVYTFGDGGGGKLGHGDGGRFHWIPRKVDGMGAAEVVGIAAGEAHCLCTMRDGRVLAWGSGPALGLASTQLTEYAHVNPGSAGNYESLPGDTMHMRQAHVPMDVPMP